MKILFASDMCFNMYEEFPGGDYIRSLMDEPAAEFRKADFSMLNLENIFGNKAELTPIIKSGPNLISTDEFIGFIDFLHPDVVGLANNHCSDFGEEALMGTIRLLRDKGYKTAGAGKNLEEAYESVVLEKDGLKVAIIAVCENEPGVADDETPGSAGYNLFLVNEKIKQALAKGEMPIIYFHGGNEYNPFPSPEKTELYRLFIELGAKAVIAMHTHCPQGYEVYKGCPIVYSMGNFFFPSRKSPARTWFHGYMTVLDISAENISFEIIPYRFDSEKHHVLDGEEKEEFMRYINYLCEPICDKKRIADYFDAWSVYRGLNASLRHMHFTPEIQEGAPETLAQLKNLMCCEAHNELAKNTMKLVHDRRIEDAKKLVPEIEKLRNMEL